MYSPTQQAADKSNQAAKLFMKHAIEHELANNAIDAISRMYYACFHSMKAYIHLKSKGIVTIDSVKKMDILTYVTHSDLRLMYFTLYKRNTANMPYIFNSKPNKTLDVWHNCREEFDYHIKETSFIDLSILDRIHYDKMKEFVEAHISFIDFELV